MILMTEKASLGRAHTVTRLADLCRCNFLPGLCGQPLSFDIHNSLAMAGILQHAEQIMELSHTINRSVQGTTTRAGPFTRAMLETPLGDLIRDVDPSEIGLFTLVPSTSSITHPSIVSEDLNASAHASQRAEIARIALPIATPLRKPPPGTRRGEDGKRITEHDPEVYINAALRLLDR